MNIENKSILAKLLATENVSVEHKNVRTAYFDLKERKVVLPVFRDMSSDLYDLLIGHEVSHALNTPLEGWHDAASTKGRGFKSFLNIVEDARIERDIKTRYPGLTKNFFKGYRELYEMDFFGLDRDINEYPLIDRINLHFKVGMFAAVEFSDEELIYVDKVAQCETWDDVVEVATELYELSKFEEAMIDMADDIQTTQQGEVDEDAETEEVSDDRDGEGETAEVDSDGDDNQVPDDEEAEEEAEQEVPSDMFTEDGDIDPASITDMNYRNNEDKLIQSDAPERHYANFPKLDYKKWINMDPWAEFEALEMYRKVEVKVEDNWSTWDEVSVPYDQATEELVNHFNKKNRAYINMMVQQFEAKRKAAQFAKAREHKTGDLNMNKLWATQLTEDVFLSNTIVPDGKNHGMMLVIDFSGSMHNKIQATIEQMLIQVTFCRKVNIPYEVYSFTCSGRLGSYNAKKHLIENQRENDLKILDEDLNVMKLFSSDMSTAAHKQAVRNILAFGASYTQNNHRYEEKLPYSYFRHVNAGFSLGGTPLVETVLILRDRANDFRRENNIDVLNAVFLTDGGNTGDLGIPNRQKGLRNETIVITENGMTTGYTGKKNSWNFRFSDLVCDTVIKHFEKTTGARVINYFLTDASKSDLKWEYVGLNGWESEPEFEANYKTQWLREGFMSIDGLNGFPTAYVLRSKNMGAVEELEVNGEKKGDLVRGFKKFQGSKSKSRKFLVNFIEKIA